VGDLVAQFSAYHDLIATPVRSKKMIVAGLLSPTPGAELWSRSRGSQQVVPLQTEAVLRSVAAEFIKAI
jgi:hypothetical protein